MIAGGSNTHPVSRRILSLIDQHPYLSTLAAMPDGPESGILLTKFCTLRGLDIEVVKEELAKLRQPLGGAQESATRLPGGGSGGWSQAKRRQSMTYGAARKPSGKLCPLTVTRSASVSSNHADASSGPRQRSASVTLGTIHSLRPRSNSVAYSAKFLREEAKFLAKPVLPHTGGHHTVVGAASQPLHPRKQDLAARIEDSAVLGQEMNNATYEVAGDLVKRII